MERHMLRATVLLACLSLVVGATLAQRAGGRRGKPDPVEPLWQVPTEVIFPFDELFGQGLIPVTQQQGQGGDTTVALISLTDGQPVWSSSLGTQLGRIAVSAMAATETALTVGLHQSLGAISLEDGSSLWQQRFTGMLNTGSDLSPVFRQIQWFGDRWTRSQQIGGAFLVVGDRICVGVNGVIYCMDPQSGKTHWQQKAGFTLSAPMVDCGDAALVATDQGLGALSVEGGDFRWVARVPRVSQLYVFDGEVYALSQDGVRRIDPAGGEVLWGAPTGAESPQFLYPCGSCVVYLTPQRVAIIDREQGEILWNANTGSVWPALNEELIFVSPANSGELVCLSIENLTEVWRTSLGNRRAARFIAAGETVVGISPSWIGAFDAGTGELLWDQAPAPGELIQADTFATDDRAIYFHLARWLEGFDLRTGECLVESPGQYFFVDWMRVKDGVLYLHGGDGANKQLLAIPLPGGEA